MDNNGGKGELLILELYLTGEAFCEDASWRMRRCVMVTKMEASNEASTWAEYCTVRLTAQRYPAMGLLRFVKVHGEDFISTGDPWGLDCILEVFSLFE